jgi:hypothetical protein
MRGPNGPGGWRDEMWSRVLLMHHSIGHRLSGGTRSKSDYSLAHLGRLKVDRGRIFDLLRRVVLDSGQEPQDRQAMDDRENHVFLASHEHLVRRQIAKQCVLLTLPLRRGSTRAIPG